MKTIAILTSGGDAPGMNAVIRSVVRTAIYNDLKVLAIKEGYNGLIKGDIETMTLSSVADIIHRGGTILRTARSDEFMTEEGINQALEVIKKFKIDAIVVLGGDGTLRGARELARRGVKVIGVPCTIDNDLGYTDYTIGFLTAVETAVSAISKLRDTSESHGRAIVLQVMGRNCGDIALYSGIAGGAESIVIPEVELDTDAIIKKIKNGRKRGKKHHIIVAAEGALDAYELARIIEEKGAIETRVTVLGYVQRGGVPTVQDRILASDFGYEAVNLLLSGKSGLALGYRSGKIIEVDIDEALETKKAFDKDQLKMVDILSI
ncbi:MAG: 6-phosphofructokinase [Eubacteriales bacterium]|uniref:6-phosphofructokinase n=1 Tax=Fenollaria sp. TaxID=1965292 RepID=UPI002A75074F|nr:6-phosphofructokinase [Fenollaria sp.]MDD7340154.1 6-phosphofructokinase [Eubacteriales bacterium]MDY3105578.1 6-phosphofructokinase [Fenollaria sp.]